MHDNPYRSPAYCGEGVWDHSLFWRVVRFCRWIALAFALMDVVTVIHDAHSLNPQRIAKFADSFTRVEWMRLVSHLQGMSP